MPTEITYTLKALTNIWTGDADGKPGRLIATGLVGSIRWWFEVLVRGLGGPACDPSHHEDNKPGPCPEKGIKDPLKPGHHCVVCELFGCTGWARKFRFEVLDQNDQPKQSQIKKDETFKLRFTELRPICPEEWALLDLTLRLIAEYGAIGGRTTLKNRDYGLIGMESTNPSRTTRTTESELRQYVASRRRLRHGGFAWASLEHFWFVPSRFLNRNAFNTVLQSSSWLAGERGVSKKIFSFKEPEKARRTFGFVRSLDELDEMKQCLRAKAWSDLEDDQFLKGSDIPGRFLGVAGGTS